MGKDVLKAKEDMRQIVAHTLGELILKKAAQNLQLSNVTSAIPEK